MLMWMKSVPRVSADCSTSLLIVRTWRLFAQDEHEASKYKGLIDLLIPVCKAWCSDVGFKVTERAMQIHGGYGYCSEYPIEQFLRDIKITSIYEGANGIQALDLVGRKVSDG